MTGQLQQKRAEVSALPTIMRLAGEASIEINVHELEDLEASRAFLPPGRKIYVSCLPKQTWEETEAACRALQGAGFDPVPHIAVRRIDSERTLDRVLHGLVDRAGVREVLLIAGDGSQALGPYLQVVNVLRSRPFGACGLRRISIGGHPEGHPRVPLGEIRRAEREKATVAAQLGLDATFVTQFFFEATPFLDWVEELRADGVTARIMAGLAGPARITTLFKYAARCGAGPSIRALGARPGSLAKLIGHHGPQEVMCILAQALQAGTSDFAGIHFFCFGGYLSTCEWVHRVVNGGFASNS